MDKPKRHAWSGWPGAYCFYCGSEDPVESALAMGWFDSITGKCDTPEHEQIVKDALVCHADELTRRKVQQGMGLHPDTTKTDQNTSPDIGEGT